MAAKKTMIIIAGPTAVGKTAAAIQVAKYFGTEIISADSRQCYKELLIGVARPSEEELSQVPHYFIASHSIHEKINAAVFEKYALEKAELIFSRHDVAVLVGGTGMYIKAFCEGMDEIPEVPEEVRAEIIEAYRVNGLDWLQQEVRSTDPAFYAVGEIQNPQRLMRALEVAMATGKSILHFQKGKKRKREFDVVKLALELPRYPLQHNISHRVDKMMDEGLLDEVRSLLPFQELNALQTVGYKEVFDFLNGRCSLHDATEAIKKHTRQYAKRQLTWFKKDGEYLWFAPGNESEILDAINKHTKAG